MHRIAPLAVVAGLLLAGCTTGSTDADLAPEQQRMVEHALHGMEVAEGLDLQLFAAEPMVVNPTNMDIDARGRVWATEGINYRMHLNPDNPVQDGGDRIVILEDTDGDAKADQRTVFYQGEDINSALGIGVFSNHAIVSVSPHVFRFTDTDGDGQADEKEVLFSGIEGVQHDHGVHAFIFGPDGKLYFNFGNEGKKLLDGDGNPVYDHHTGEAVAEGRVFQQGMVFRMNPDGTELEVLGDNFRNNYEVAVDSYGTLWQSDNDDDGNQATRINFVMEYGNYGFRDEMTGAGWRAPRTGMHDEIPLRHWHLNDPGVVPNLLQTGAGSPTGITIYEGDLLPEVFQGQMIHAEAGHNVIRSYPVQPSGAGYTAEVVDLVKAGTDPWFRPSDVTVAPDGSLFISDWYDPGVGGHQVGDLNQGRIFRVAPTRAADYTVAAVDVDTPEGAIEALKSPNMATRYLGWTALRDMDEAIPALEALRNDANPRFQARALWLLSKLDGGAAYVEDALGSNDTDLRITALRAARQNGMDLVPIVTDLANDPSPQIRREVAVAIRNMPAAEAAPIWATLAQQYDGEDRWYLEALGIAADGRWDAMYDALVAAQPEAERSPDVVWRARTASVLPSLAALITDPATTVEDRLRFFRAFDFHDSPRKADVLPSLLAAGDDQITILALKHATDPDRPLSAQARQALDQALGSVVGTQDYIDLVSRFELREQVSQLFDMAMAQANEQLGTDAAGLVVEFEGADRFASAIQSGDEEQALTAVEAVGDLENGPAKELLRETLYDETRSLAVRRAATVKYGRGWWGEELLVEAAENDAIPDELKGAASTVLFNAWRAEIRERAAEHLERPAASGEKLPRVQDLAKLDGDAAAGQAVFQTHCTTCHVVAGGGVDFGPALSEIGSKLPKEALFTSILHPSAGISFGYEGYMVQRTEGSPIVGLITSETETELTVKTQDGGSTVIPVAQVASKTQLDQSLMPALQALMTQQELVDLVEYLASLK
ncbi:MAG: hypothetical protein RhofKO_06710 [Rhodothermales bacterium]